MTNVSHRAVPSHLAKSPLVSCYLPVKNKLEEKKESTLHAVCVVCYVKDDHLLQSGVQHACLPDMHFTLFQLSLNAMGLENLQYHLWSLSISILL